MPRELGSTIPSTAAVSIAASMAFPPAIKIFTPAKLASGWLDATIPFLAKIENFVGIKFTLTLTLSHRNGRGKLHHGAGGFGSPATASSVFASKVSPLRHDSCILPGARRIVYNRETV